VRTPVNRSRSEHFRCSCFNYRISYYRIGVRKTLVEKWGKGEKNAGLFAELLGEDFAVEK